MGILFILVAVIGIVSWGIVKSDELSGLGRQVKADSLRHPHGRLEQVYCEHPPVRRPFAARLRSVPCRYGPAGCRQSYRGRFGFEHAGVLFGVVAVDFLSSGAGVLLVAGECLLRLAKPAQSFANYIVLLVAGIVAATVFGVSVLAVGGHDFTVGFEAAYLLANAAGYAVGCSAAAALMEEPVRFERRFEDGAESSVKISPRSAAYRAYGALMVDERAWNAGRKE
ncbi:MAG: hypothetical protein ACLTQI_00455 [Slackia sp.]